MASKKIMTAIALSAILLSSCVRYGTDPSSNPTPTEIFDGNPRASDFENLKVFMTETSVALTLGAGGPTNTPSGLITFTPSPTSTATQPPGVVCTAPACGAGQTLICPSGNCPNACGLVCSGSTATFTPQTPGAPPPVVVRPATWTLHEGEFPWCIARRFDVDPGELLSRSGLVDGLIYPAGTLLQIPQNGFFPGPRALLSHPANYTVKSSDETFYSIACLYGDPHPQTIADANSLPISSVLNVGQLIKIP